jgi:hypothetical protein
MLNKSPGIRGRCTDSVTPTDMTRVTEDDFYELARIARAYCRTVDASRGRKRMDGSATMAPNGAPRYGTDDVSDDVTQDAVLIFARRLRQIIDSCDPSAVSVATREAESWQYIRKDGRTIIVGRTKIMYWSVRDAAAQNGYRLDVPAEPIDTVPGAQMMRGAPHADVLPTLAMGPAFAANSATIFRSAWGDGSDFRTLGAVMRIADRADNLKRAGIIGQAAQELHGGPRNSSCKVQRTGDDARREWQELTSRLDEVRESLVYQGAQRPVSE